MNYKQLVHHHLQPIVDAGMTHGAVARRLGFKASNFVSMILNMARPNSLLPAARLPAFCSLCGLTAIESLRLFKRLVAYRGKKGIQMDVVTFEWLVKCTALAFKETKEARRAA